ncbi:hypothetical protein [Enterovibrio norvegicus]|uniref:hypothetical protein n=1 Tax=Enterovibrio norvegicus TaxID=188144 RepID=UPI00352E9CC1
MDFIRLQNPHSFTKTIELLRHVLLETGRVDAYILLDRALFKVEQDEKDYRRELEQALCEGTTLDVRSAFHHFGDYSESRDHRNAVNGIDSAMSSIKEDASNILPLQESIDFVKTMKGERRDIGYLRLHTPYTFELTLEMLDFTLTKLRRHRGKELLRKAIEKSEQDAGFQSKFKDVLEKGTTLDIRDVFSEWGTYFAAGGLNHRNAVDAIDSSLHLLRCNAVGIQTLRESLEL